MSDITSMDMANVMGSFIFTELDAFQNLHKELEEKDKEIERLNNIISELEKWLDKKEKLTFNSWNKGIHEVQRKLQELKGDESNEKN